MDEMISELADKNVLFFSKTFCYTNIHNITIIPLTTDDDIQYIY